MSFTLPLSTRYARFNDIPPRMMWNVVTADWPASPSGYCGETSIQGAGLLFGQYIPQYDIREIAIKYYRSSDHRFHEYKKELGTGAKDREELDEKGQYYVQVILTKPPESGDTCETHVLKSLGLTYEQIFSASSSADFLSQLKTNVFQGYPVIIGVQDQYSGDTDYDHIVTVMGWGTNKEGQDGQQVAYDDDEIVFSDHGLVCDRGSVPYVFHLQLRTTSDGTRNDGGCPYDPGCNPPTGARGKHPWFQNSGPVFDFVCDTSYNKQWQTRVVHIGRHKYQANAYHLPPNPSSGYYGLVIKGPAPRSGDQGNVRLDTDLRYEFPCITTSQAQSNTRPQTSSTVRFRISVTGLASDTPYILNFYDSIESRDAGEACGSQQITSDANGCWSGSPTYDGYRQDWPTDRPFLVRCASAE